MGLLDFAPKPAGMIGSNVLDIPGQPANPWAPPSAALDPAAAPGMPQYKGLAGFVDRFLRPTNPIGQLGKYISQSAGGLFGGVYSAADQDLQEQQQQQFARQKYALDLAKANQPELRTVGNDLVAIPQGGGSPQVLFSGQPAPTALERNYTFLNGQDPKLGSSYLKNQANPVRAVPFSDERGDGIMFIRPGDESGYPPPATGGMPPLPDGYKVRGAPPASAPQAGIDPAPILSSAQSTGLISRSDAGRIRASLGPKGAGAFDAWLKTHNIRIVD